MATTKQPKGDAAKASHKPYTRTRTAPDERRSTDVTIAVLDRVEALHGAWPARVPDSGGRRDILVHHWADALLTWALDRWEPAAVEVIGELMTELRRMPTPAEIGARMRRGSGPAEHGADLGDRS